MNGLDHAAYAIRRFEHRAVHTAPLQLERRCQPRNSRSNDGYLLHGMIRPRMDTNKKYVVPTLGGLCVRGDRLKAGLRTFF